MGFLTNDIFSPLDSGVGGFSTTTPLELKLELEIAN
jgi:hypothetical protein